MAKTERSRSKKSSTKKSNLTPARKAPDEAATYQHYLGNAASVKDPEDGKVKDGYVEHLQEYDNNGTPHGAVFKLRQGGGLIVVDPKDVELYEGVGFPRGY